MGQRQETLRNILCKNGFEFIAKPAISKTEIIKSEYYPELLRVYKILGGIQENIPNRFTHFDIAVTEGIIELDEERHFNDYRALTLESKIYRRLKTFPLAGYKFLCDEKKEKCLSSASHGGNWKSKSSDAQFGKSSPEKDLEPPGSSRWKQRAFYDFVKDSLNVIYPAIRLARLSVYEMVGDKTVNEILTRNLKAYFPQVIDLIKHRLDLRKI